MKPYSLDLRQSVLAVVDAGQLHRGQIAGSFAVSTAWIRRLVQRRRETGSIARCHTTAAAAPKLGAEPLRRLGGLVQTQPDATLAELRARLGEPVRVMTICRALQRPRLPLKKKSEEARPDVARQRHHHRAAVGHLEPGRLIYIDEAAARRKAAEWVGADALARALADEGVDRQMQ
jgi:transposase